MGYEKVIPLIGDFGQYQKRIYFLLCLPAIICAFHKLGNVFLIAEPQHRCQLQNEFSNATYALNADDWKENYPWNDLLQKYSSCQMLVNNHTIDCDEYIYDREVYGYTVVMEWNLVCDKNYYVTNGNSMFMGGVMIGSIVFGDLSDRFGRKLIFFISLVIQMVFGLLAAYSPTYWLFTTCRVIIGATTSGVFLVAYVIAMEMVSPKKRLIAGTVCHMFFSVGFMLTALLAYYIEDWRHLQLALTMSGIIFFSYWWLIPESARWLLSKNRVEQAKEVIRMAAKANGIQLDEPLLNSSLQEDNEMNGSETPKKTATVSVLDVFRYPNLRQKSLIIFFDWLANSITYYGLSWSTNDLAGNPYLNFVLSGAVEIPGYTFLIFTLNRWGRKIIMCGCMIVAGIALLANMLVPAGSQYQWITVVLAMFGKLAITASYGAVYIFSTEQFPTVIRNAGLGMGSTCARLGSIAMPYINSLAHIWSPLPLIIFGSFALVGGVLSLLLPETLNRKLPETMEEGEMFGKKKIEQEK